MAASGGEVAHPLIDSQHLAWRTNMQWEYQLEIGTFEEFNDLTKRLNELGLDRWEAVGISGDGKADDFTVLLKRAKRKKSKATWG